VSFFFAFYFYLRYFEVMPRKIRKHVKVDVKAPGPGGKVYDLDSLSLDAKLKLIEDGSDIPLTMDEQDVLRERLKAVRLQQRKLLKGSQLPYFCPNGAQEKIIKNFAKIAENTVEPGIVTLFGGNGVGKTALASNIVGNIIWGTHPFLSVKGSLGNYLDPTHACNWLEDFGEPPESWFDYPIFHKWPYFKVMRIVSDPAHVDVDGAVTVEIEKWWPKKRYERTKGKFTYFSSYQTDTNWKIEVKTYQQPTTEHESQTLGLVWADEPMPEHLFSAYASRMRMGGVSLMTMTPIFSGAYLKEQIIDNPDPQVTHNICDIEENCFDHGTRGKIPHARVQSMVSRYRPQEREARKSGKIMALEGTVHPMFRDDLHGIDPYAPPAGLPKRDDIFLNAHLYQWYQVVDPHDKKPDAIIWVAMDITKRKFVVDEFPDQGYAPYHEIAQRSHTYEILIKSVLKPKEVSMYKTSIDTPHISRLMDPRFGKAKVRKSDRHGLTIQQEWEMHYNEGFIVDISDEFSVGRNSLDNNLAVREDGYPGIMFYTGYARNTMYALAAWQYKRHEGKSAETRDINEDAADKNSDYPRCLHYLCVFDPVFQIVSPELVGWRDKIHNKGENAGVSGPHSWLGT
jgi:hypothetical protein